MTSSPVEAVPAQVDSFHGGRSTIPGDVGLRGATGFTPKERQLIAGVDGALERGVALREWFFETSARDAFAKKFRLTHTFNRPQYSYSFFDEAPLPNGLTRVMGTVPTLFYDQPKYRFVEDWAEQVRAYALRYFLRVSDFRLPEPVADERYSELPPLLRWLSACQRPLHEAVGFGYKQYYFKLQGSDEVERFPESERFAIVDQRELEHKYEWILAGCDIFNFDLFFPVDPEIPKLQLPLRQHQFIVFSRKFMSDEAMPAPGVVGHYGCGYAMLSLPDDAQIVAYGPGHFEVGYQIFHFTVRDDGRTFCDMTFVVNRPRKILNLSLNPLEWAVQLARVATAGRADDLLDGVERSLPKLPRIGFDPISASIAAANLFTLGQAGRRLCISREQLEKYFLIFHSMQYYTMITGSLLTWRQIRNWHTETDVPEWVETGRST